MNDKNMQPGMPAMLNVSEFAAYLRCSRPTLYKLAKEDPSFPRAFRAGKRCVRYLARDVEMYVIRKTGGA